MNWRRLILVFVVSTCLANCANAGLFSRKPKTSPQRAQELIGIVRSDPKESKRAAAVEELAYYDPQNYPEVVPVLLEAIHDAAPEVRVQAVTVLGKIRPVSQEIGMALEQTLNNDNSMKVRLQARTTLWQYHLAGFHAPKQDGPQLPGTPANGTSPPIATNQEPPLADPLATPPASNVAQPPSTSRFMPVPAKMGSEPARIQPIPMPVLQTPPASNNQGPDLTPPQ